MPLRMRNSGLSDTLVLSDNVGYDAMHSVVKNSISAGWWLTFHLSQHLPA